MDSSMFSTARSANSLRLPIQSVCPHSQRQIGIGVPQYLFLEIAQSLQELDNDTPYIDIPTEIRDFYKMYRPSPLVRAYCLEEALGTPAKIYYKFEGNNTSGSYKLNSVIAQAYYAKKQGLKGVTTETGAGQWGTALSMACAYLDLDCKVYMVKVSYEQKPFRREVMRTYGAGVTPSPSMSTEVGKKINAQFPGTNGSLGCAISEAVEDATLHEGYDRDRKSVV